MQAQGGMTGIGQKSITPFSLSEFPAEKTGMVRMAEDISSWDDGEENWLLDDDDDDDDHPHIKRPRTRARSALDHLLEKRPQDHQTQEHVSLCCSPV